MSCREEDAAIPKYCKDDERQGALNHTAASPKYFLWKRFWRKGTADGKGAAFGFAECLQDASCRDAKGAFVLFPYSMIVQRYYDSITAVSRLCRDLFTEEMRCVICNAAAAAARGAAALPRPRARRMRERAAAVPFCGRLKTSFPRSAAAARGAVCARHAAACAAECRARTGSAPARA